MARGSSGVFRLCAPRALTGQVMPAVAQFLTAQGEAPSVLFVRDGGSARELLAGIVDLLIVVGATSADSLEAHRLGDVELAGFVAPSHGMARCDARGFSAAGKYGWVTAPNDFPDRSCWPAEIQRQVTLEVTDCLASRDACLEGVGPALLPRRLAASYVESRQLVEVPALSFPSARVHALRRPRLIADRAEAMINCLEQAFRDKPKLAYGGGRA